jgi:hypothetical protein
MLKITLLSTDEAALNQLANTTSKKPPEVTIGPVLRVPGAAESWFELLTLWGIVALPAGVAGNLIAAWIVSLIAKPESHEPRPPEHTIGMIVENGARRATIEIKTGSEDAVRAVITQALQDVGLS